MKINDLCATQNDAAVTIPWPQFPDSHSPLGKGGWVSLTSETKFLPLPPVDVSTINIILVDLGNPTYTKAVSKRMVIQFYNTLCSILYYYLLYIPLLLFQEPFAKLHNKQQFDGNYESWTQMSSIYNYMHGILRMQDLACRLQCLPSIIFLNIFQEVSKFRASPNDVDRLGNTGPLVSLCFNLCNDGNELVPSVIYMTLHIPQYCQPCHLS